MSAYHAGRRAAFAHRTLQAALLIAAVIHLLPLPGLLGAGTLEAGYGLPPLDASTELLLRHRALVFGLMAGLLLAALRWPAWRAPAIALVLASDIGFLVLALTGPPLGTALERVVAFDLASILALLLATALIAPAGPRR